MMQILNFDVINLIWWVIQAFLIGFLFNIKFFNNSQDRVLFAPITGIAIVCLIGTAGWLWFLPMHIIGFIFTGLVIVGAIIFFKNFPRQKLTVPALWALGATLVILHGSLVPFVEKLWQGYPLDRWGYLSASMLFAKHNLQYFNDAVTALEYNGNKQAFYTDPLFLMALTEIKARIGATVSFPLFAWATPTDLYRLANAWEVFFRVIQFTGIFILFWKVLKKEYLALFLSLAVIFGYWVQFQQDYNAWPHLMTMSMMFAISVQLLTIISSRSFSNWNRYYLYLLSVAMIVSHPEFGLVLALGFVIAMLTNDFLRSHILQRKKIIFFEFLGLTGLIFLIHPHIASWVQRMFLQSPIMTGGTESIARGIYRIFGSIGERQLFVDQITASPFNLLLDPFALLDMAIGLFGFSYLSYIGSLLTLFVVGGILIFLVAQKYISHAYSRFSNNSAFLQRNEFIARSFAYVLLFSILLLLSHHFGYLRFYEFSPFHFSSLDMTIDRVTVDRLASLIFGLFVLFSLLFSTQKNKNSIMNFSLFFIGYLALIFAYFIGTQSVGGAYRLLGIWGGFATTILLIYLANSGQKSLKTLAIIFASAHLLFGASIFYVTNNGGMETYPKFYPNATGVRHLEIESSRSVYDFDYNEIIPELKRCHAVFLDFPSKDVIDERAPRFFVVNLMIFLQNNGIPMYGSMPYRNSVLLSDAYFSGFERDEVNADCVVEEEIRNGRMSYKFVQVRPVQQ